MIIMRSTLIKKIDDFDDNEVDKKKIDCFNEEENSLEQFSMQWNNISNGTSLYRMVAHSDPEDIDGTELGNMVVADGGGCTTSKFGDEHLTFQHQRIEDDAEIKPEWANSYFTEC